MVVKTVVVVVVVRGEREEERRERVDARYAIVCYFARKLFIEARRRR